MPALLIRLPDTQTARELQAAKPVDRTRMLERLITGGLRDLAKDGIMPPGGQSPLPIVIRLRLSNTHAREIASLAAVLRVPEADVVREVLRSTDHGTERRQLEDRYRASGGPGDPTRLSVGVLRCWLDVPTERTPLVEEILLQMTQTSFLLSSLQAKLEDLQRRGRPTQADVLRMGDSELKAYVRSLGGRVSRDVRTRGALLALARHHEGKR